MANSKLVPRLLPQLGFLDFWLKKGGILVDFHGYVNLIFYFVRTVAISAFILFFTLGLIFLLPSTILLPSFPLPPFISSFSYQVPPLLLGFVYMLIRVLVVLPMVILITIAATVITGLLLVFYPYSKMVERRTKFEIESPFASAYMSILSSAGSPPARVFERMAETASLFGEIGTEVKIIARDIVLFGRGIIEALEAACFRSPSESWSDLLKGTFGTIQSGGDISRYFHEATLSLMELRKTEFERYKEIISRYAVVTNSVLCVGPLLIAIMLCVMGIFGGTLAGVPITILLVVLAFGIIPAIAVSLTLMLDAITPPLGRGSLPDDVARARQWARRFFYISITFGSAATIALAIIGYFPPISQYMPFTIPYITVLVPVFTSVIVGLVPFIFWDLRFRWWRNKIERNLPNLLRDVAEAQKTGMSFIAALKRASEKDYGPLSKEMHKVCLQMASGVTYEEALTSMAKRIKSRLVDQATTLIVEAGRSGGNVQKLMDQIATYITDLQTMDQRRRAELKGFEYEVYAMFGVFLFSLTMIFTVLISSIATTATTTASAAFPFSVRIDKELYRVLFFAVASSEAAAAGLVSGKLGEGTVYGGLRHVAILLAATLVVFLVFVRI
jgi:flagellar protein FlaJ